MLMVRLVLDLLERRASGDPVPVLVAIASWDPTRQDLHGWLAGQLSIGYPWLTAPAPPGPAPTTRVQALLANGLIMPILDGLDEVAAALRGPAIAGINDAVRPGEHLAVTSRTAQWRKVVRPGAGAEITLRAAAGVELRPLRVADVAGYLRADAGGPRGTARWDPVMAALDTGGPVAQALCSPLMAGPRGRCIRGGDRHP
jgi:hypothetical protein